MKLKHVCMTVVPTRNITKTFAKYVHESLDYHLPQEPFQCFQHLHLDYPIPNLVLENTNSEHKLYN